MFFSAFELRNSIGAILNNPAVIELFAEIVVKCEVKPDEDICKSIQIKSSCQDGYSSILFFQSQRYCSEVLSVWNYSEEIITKSIWRVEFVDKECILSSFLMFYRVKLPGKVFYSNTYTDCLVSEFPVLEHLCSTSLYPINVNKTSLIVRKWKIDWGCECLVRMQS